MVRVLCDDCWSWQMRWVELRPIVVNFVAERRTEMWRTKVAGMHRNECSMDG
jgi:hypothetical protein